ncbi:MAG: M28 family peptidase [Candidatus Kapaibacterium sp.]|jgi:aminopeptidase YwaD
MKRFGTSVFAAIALLLLAAPFTAQSLDSVLVNNIRNHVKYLASDELQGRGSGTEGNRLAGKYIADFFKNNGIPPLSADYFQKFMVPTGYVIKPETKAKFFVKVIPQGVAPESVKPVAMSWKAGTDYTPLALSDNGTVSGEIAFVGYGISNPAAGYDDYAGIDVKGKIVIIIRGTPEKKVDPHSKFAEHSALRTKVTVARDKGAAAILFVSQPSDSADQLMPLKHETAMGTSGIKALHCTRTIIDKIFPRERKMPFAEKDIIASQKPSSFMLPNVTAELTVGLEQQLSETANIIGVIRGTNPARAEEYIAIGAHYDHLGMGEYGSLYAGKKQLPHYGADDNASGTAAIMEIAARLAKQPLERPVIVMAFSGEEMGLLGSAHYVKNPHIPNAKIAAMINLDMVGRLKDNKLNVHGTGSSSKWNGWIDSLAKLHQFELSKSEDGFGPSDHSSFYGQDRPVLFFFTGLHSDYHRPTDTWDKINYTGEARIIDFVGNVIMSIASMNTLPDFVKVKQSADASRPMKFSVTLGVIPDYSDNPKGLKITGVRENSAASKAGIQTDDIIIKLGETTIKNIYDYTYALGKFKAGDEAMITVLRGPKEDKEVTVKVRFDAKQQ